MVPVESHSQTTDLTIGNYAKISERRITRTVYEYTYRADVTNSGAAVLNVAATATSTSPYTTIIDNTLSFGDVPAGATVSSSDTFSFRHDRSYAFSWSNLSWNIQYEISIGNTLSVGPEGGILQFPNGVILDIPAGAVNELVDIKITDLSCEEVDAIILSQQQLATHQKRCLRGFSAEPHGILFNTPIRAFVPVTLEPGEIPVRIEVDMNSHVQWTINAELVYWGNDGFIEMSLEHFSEEWLAALLLNFREQTCKRCDTYIPYIDGQFWCGPLYDPSPVFRGLQPGACQLLNTRPLPPETKTEREKCAPGVRCCMEELMEIKVTEADFISGQCQLVGSKLTATFPTCDEPNTITESLSEAAGCPEDMKFEIKIVSDAPWIYACQQANLKAELTGISKDGKVLFEAATFPADWEIIIGDPNVAQLGADIPPNGKIVEGGREEGDVLIRASAIGAEDKIFADYALTVVSNIGSFLVDPAQETIKVEDGRILIAKIIGAEGNILDPSTVTWSSSDPSIAYLIQDTGGWTSVEGRDCGTVIITAKYQHDCETVITTAMITVEDHVSSCQVNPPAITLSVGQVTALEIIPYDAQGKVADIDPDLVTWSPSDAVTAWASPSVGLLTVVGANNIGQSTITATYQYPSASRCGQKRCQAQVTVNCELCTFEIIPSATVLILGNNTKTLRAELRDVGGQLVNILPSATINWTTNSGGVSLSSTTGSEVNVTPNDEGPVTITATYTDPYGQKTATAIVRVRSFQGVWDTYFDGYTIDGDPWLYYCPMGITVNGTTATGNFKYYTSKWGWINGQLSGNVSVDGYKFTGIYLTEESGNLPSESGTFSFQLAPDGNSFTGFYTDFYNKEKDWYGNRR